MSEQERQPERDQVATPSDIEDTQPEQEGIGNRGYENADIPGTNDNDLPPTPELDERMFTDEDPPVTK